MSREKRRVRFSSPMYQINEFQRYDENETPEKDHDEFGKGKSGGRQAAEKTEETISDVSNIHSKVGRSSILRKPKVNDPQRPKSPAAFADVPDGEPIAPEEVNPTIPMPLMNFPEEELSTEAIDQLPPPSFTVEKRSRLSSSPRTSRPRSSKRKCFDYEDLENSAVNTKKATTSNVAVKETNEVAMLTELRPRRAKSQLAWGNSDVELKNTGPSSTTSVKPRAMITVQNEIQKPGTDDASELTTMLPMSATGMAQGNSAAVSEARIIYLMKQILRAREITEVGPIDVLQIQGGTVTRTYEVKQPNKCEEDFVVNLNEGWERLELLAQGLKGRLRRYVIWKRIADETAHPYLKACFEGYPNFLFCASVPLKKKDKLEHYSMEMDEERRAQVMLLMSLKCIFNEEVFRYLEKVHLPDYPSDSPMFLKGKRIFKAAAHLLKKSLGSTHWIFTNVVWKYAERFISEPNEEAKENALSFVRERINMDVLSQEKAEDRQEFLLCVDYLITKQ